MKIVGFWYSEKANDVVNHVKEHKDEYIKTSIRLAILTVILVNAPQSIVAFKMDGMVKLVSGFYNAIP